MSPARDDQGENSLCLGVCNFVWSLYSQLRISVARPMTVSEMQPHSLGHDLHPKGNLRAISSSQTPFMQTCVSDFTAVSQLKYWRMYADFQSILEIQMRLVMVLSATNNVMKSAFVYVSKYAFF